MADVDLIAGLTDGELDEFRDAVARLADGCEADVWHRFGQEVRTMSHSELRDLLADLATRAHQTDVSEPCGPAEGADDR